MLKIKYITLSSILGILIGYYFKRYELIISLLFCIFCIIIYFIVTKNSFNSKFNSIFINKISIKLYNIYFLIFLFFFMYFIFRYYNYNNKFIKYINNENNIIIGKILKFNKETNYYNVYKFRIHYINNNKVNSNIYIYLPKDKIYNNGDYIKCSGEIEHPSSSRNEGGFNNKLYLYSNNIYGYGYCKNVDIIHKNTNKIQLFINKYKSECINKINDKLNKNEAGILISMIFANKSYLTNDIKNTFSNSNLSYILNVSGSTITYIISFLMFSTNQISNKKRNLLISILICIYLLFIDFSISLIRFCIIYIILKIYKLCKMKINNFDVVYLALLIFLIYNPIMLFNSSIILSFLCVFAMKLLFKRINYRLEYNFNIKNNKSIKKLINVISMTISIYIVTFPIITIYFNKIYVLSIFSNVFTFLIYNIIVIISFIYLYIFKLPIISDIFLFILSIFSKTLIILANFFSFIPFSNILVFPLNFVEITIYYFIIYTIYINNNYYYIIKNILIRLYKNHKKRCVYIITIFLIAFSIFIYKDYTTLKINFIDVGQGDCILIRLNGKNILIDGGGSTSDFDVGEKTLIPYLLNKRILEIDYIIISHFDTDHCRGLISVINNLNVKNLVISEYVIESEEYKYFFENIKDKDINIIKTNTDNILKLGSKANISFLSPWNEFSDVENRENNLSIVCKLNYYNFSCLFTGDIDNIIEEKLIEKYSNKLKSDILKIAHHGSKSSSCENFLKLVSPKIGLIGVGKNNYGHPNIEVINRLKNINCKIYRTDLMGEIQIKVNKNKKITVKNIIN